MDWIDRITGARHRTPGAPFVPGQWRYGGEGRIGIRGAEARSGDLLLPGADGGCHAPSLGSVRCDPSYSADDDALASLRLVGERLRTLEVRPWSDWVVETPLLPALDDALDETPLERQIAAKIGHLEAACERPRAHLRIDEERLAVARCKRPSPRAPRELAARSEDWERRTLWGVRPRRVLGLVRDELFDIYENRVAVALVDHLDVVLLRRIRSVRRLVRTLQQRESYQDALEDSRNYRRAKRILRLWGEALEDKGHLAHAASALGRLTALRRRVLALKDTPLYRQIGGVHAGRLQLRMTNVLIHDGVYRRVAELWIAWEEQVRSQHVDPDHRWRWEQDAAIGLDRFVFLVIVRALEVLGFAPGHDARAAPLGVEGTWTLEGPGGTVELGRDASGVWIRAAQADSPLRFLSLPAMLEAGVAVGAWIEAVRDRDVVVVVLPADEPRAPLEARRRLRSPGYTDDRGPRFVAVAPWDLESVERVARVIRGYAWSALFDRYPFAVEVPAGWSSPTSTPRWLRVTERKLHVIRPSAEHERPWRDLERRLADADAAVAVVQAKLDACDPRDGRENRKRLHLRQALEQAVAEAEAIRRVQADLRRAIAAAELLRVCPVCRVRGDVHAFEQDEDLFRCRCADCGASWGQRRCTSCERPFPFLDFDGNEPSEDLLDADRRYGADVLAVPLDEQAYLCSRCGKRSDGGATT